MGFLTLCYSTLLLIKEGAEFSQLEKSSSYSLLVTHALPSFLTSLAFYAFFELPTTPTTFLLTTSTSSVFFSFPTVLTSTSTSSKFGFFF